MEDGAIVLIVQQEESASFSSVDDLNQDDEQDLEMESAKEDLETRKMKPKIRYSKSGPGNPFNGATVASTSEEKMKVIEFLKKRVADPKRVFCPDCKVYILQKSMLNHIKFRHNNIKKHACSQCDYRAHTQFILDQHTQAVHVGYIFRCSQCPKTFNLEKRLRNHAETAHGDRDDRKQCPQCEKILSCAATLRKHLKTHSGIRRYKCEICSRSFSTHWACSRHQFLHSETKPFNCVACGAGFVQYKSLKQHAVSCK